MRGSFATIPLAGVLVLVALVVPSAAYTFTLNYSDPASDVAKLWTSNMTPVRDQEGQIVMSPFPTSINILWIRSVESGSGGENVTLSIETQGNITNLYNTTYEVRMYSRADNASHFILTYVNGRMTLDSNETGYAPVDLSGNHTITAAGPNPTLQNLLRLRVAKSLLGEITVWNIDATTTQVGTVYTYRDYGWQLPGNPGSAPTVLQGLVTEAGTGAALALVNVSTDVGGYWTTTSASGEYVLNLAPGTYNVTFSLNGYAPFTAQMTISSGETRELNARLVRSGLSGESMPCIVFGLVAGVGAGIILLLDLRRKRSSPPRRP